MRERERERERWIVWHGTLFVFTYREATQTGSVPAHLTSLPRSNTNEGSEYEVTVTSELHAQAERNREERRRQMAASVERREVFLCWSTEPN